MSSKDLYVDVHLLYVKQWGSIQSFYCRCSHFRNKNTGGTGVAKTNASSSNALKTKKSSTRMVYYNSSGV